MQGTFPFGFQAARHEPVFGVDGPVPAFGPGGLVAGLLHLAAVLVQRGVVAGLQLPGGGQAGLQRGGGERGQERPGDRGVDRGAADPQVPVAAAGSRRAAGAVVAGRGLALPVVVDGGLAAADAAGGQGLQVRGALPDRASARGAFRRRDVAVQPALDVLVGVPVDESVVVAGDEHLPLVGWQVTAAGAQPAVLVDIPFGPGPAVYVRAGVGRMPQRREHRFVGRLHPGDLGESPAHGSGLLQRPAQVLLTQP